MLYLDPHSSYLCSNRNPYSVIARFVHVKVKILIGLTPPNRLANKEFCVVTTGKKILWIQDGWLFQSEAVLGYRFLFINAVLFHSNLTAGAYYPAQPQYSPSVQPAPVMINPAQQQQQAPPPQQPPAQSQGPPKRERKPVVCHNKRAARLLSEVKKNWMDRKCFVCSVWNFLFYLKITIVFIMMGGSYRSAVTGSLHTVCILMLLTCFVET